MYYCFQGNGLTIKQATVEDTGIYACYLDNFVQPVVSYKFSLVVEGEPFLSAKILFLVSPKY